MLKDLFSSNVGGEPYLYSLALFAGQRLCMNFSVSRANFPTTLRSHLDVTCSCYFYLSSQMNEMVGLSFLHETTKHHPLVWNSWLELI